MKPACLDSSAWIEITHNGECPTFLKAAHDINRVIVSTNTLYEVWKYTVTHADETRALVDLLQQGIVIPPDTAISIAAANLSMRHKIAMADSLIYATALASKATLWAQDDDFKVCHTSNSSRKPITEPSMSYESSSTSPAISPALPARNEGRARLLRRHHSLGCPLASSKPSTGNPRSDGSLIASTSSSPFASPISAATKSVPKPVPPPPPR
ncbi:MAG: type II toxin-antitoxin system VapC family toxin [Verrucomicrobiales bacterium]